MRYSKLLILLLICFSGLAQEVQFSTTVSSTSCSGTLINFNVVYIPSENSVTEFDFNDGNLPTGWSSSPYTVGQPCNPARGNTPSNTNYFWATILQSGGPNNGKRFVQTNPVDVSYGGSLEFLIRYGADDPAPGCEDGEKVDEEVYLQYSINGGNTWEDIFTDWDTASGYSAAWYDWYANDIAIPLAAQTSSTIFRWYQPDNDGDIWDNWGLEDVTVNAIPAPAASWNFDFGNGDIGSSGLSTSTFSFTKLYSPSNTTRNFSVTISTTLTDGNIVGLTQNISVAPSDIVPPTVTPPINISVDTDPGSCEVVLSQSDVGTPTTSDNCSITLVENDKPSLTFNKGINVLTWTVTDNSSNTTTVTQTITVFDVESPTLTIPADIISANCSLTIGVASATDNCGVVTPTNNAPLTFPIGITPVIWSVTDSSGNTVSATQLVTVSDTIAPLITPPADVVVTTDINSCEATGVILGNPTTSDNCTVGSVSNNAPNIYPIGTTTVTWSVSDLASNTSVSFQRVTVEDNISPSITPPPNIISNSCVIILGIPTVNDNCSFTFSNDAPSSFPTGTTTITWTASDTFGNTVTSTQLVTFNDTTEPTINIQSDNITVNSDLGSCFATNVNLGSILINDDCGILNSSNDAPLQFPIGTTFVTYSVTDINGNFSSRVQSVTVIDNEPPIARAKDLVISLDSQSNLNIPYELIDNGSTDNCNIQSYGIKFKTSGLVISENQPLLEEIQQKQYQALTSKSIRKKQSPLKLLCDNLGLKEIVFSVTDASGNKASATVNIFISDNLNVCGNSINPPSDSNSTTIDTDGDGFEDDIDAFPFDPNEWTDKDDDGIGDNSDDDDDNDGFSDELEDDVGTNSLDEDDFPIDTDLDLVIDYFDDDDDNDGQSDENEIICGTDPLSYEDIPVDTDGDGIPDCLDDDDDGDGYNDDIESFFKTDNLDINEFPNLDEDGDGIFYSTDYTLIVNDNCPNISNADQSDIDQDGVGDLCDNCPEEPNSLQKNYDKDKFGDICDFDDDNDGQTDLHEIECGSDPKDENSLSPDFDGDGIPDCQDSDIDNDQVPDIIDPNSYKYDEFLVSEFISDNGDGINDVFNIVKITNYPNSSLVIYSRSGVEIYNKRNYQNTWPLDQDQKVPEGSYFYFLDLENDGLIDKRGWIYLTR